MKSLKAQAPHALDIYIFALLFEMANKNQGIQKFNVS